MRRAFGKRPVVPDDLFRLAVRRECPASELWRFLPVKRIATVRQGALEMSVNHYPMPFRFRVNGAPGSDLYIEHGYKVLVAFHPGKPEQGCHVFNAETGTNNRDGHRFGAPLLIAPMAEDAPQFSLSRSEQDAFAMRRRAAAAVRTEFRAIMPAGRRAQGASIARDGRGNTVEIERNMGGRKVRPSVAVARTNKDTAGDAWIAGGRAAREGRAVNLEPTHDFAAMNRQMDAKAARERGGFDYDALAVQLATEDAERERNAMPQ
jgi:hypothetical protein